MLGECDGLMVTGLKLGTVGVAVSRVGDALGVREGAALGERDGCDGLLLGTREGLVEGAALGETPGWMLGDGGVVDGASDGDTDGELEVVGAEDDADGDADGLWVRLMQRNSPLFRSSLRAENEATS